MVDATQPPCEIELALGVTSLCGSAPFQCVSHRVNHFTRALVHQNSFTRSCRPATAKLGPDDAPDANAPLSALLYSSIDYVLISSV